MAPEAQQPEPWDGVDRRTKQLPVGPTALTIANRVVADGKTAVDQDDVREGDLENTILRTRVEGILDLATSDEAKHDIKPTGEASNQSEAQPTELTPEQKEQAWFVKFKVRFESLPELHQGVEWADVEESLKADPEQLRKLQALDEKGHDMNVFGEENGEFVFASGWSDYNKVSTEHRNIAYDLEGQKLAEKQGYTPAGNAVDIAESMGADLADPKFHEQLRKEIAVNGWAWLKTDAATRTIGVAFIGNYVGIRRDAADTHYDRGSFRAALRVKKTA